MVLYFLRHANAGEPKLDPSKDELRPLDKLGIEQALSVGQMLAALDVKLDLVLSSPLVRALQTAEIVAGEIGQKDNIFTDAALRPEASYENFLKLLHRYSNKEELMVVGHNPSLTEFLNKFLAGDEGFRGTDLKKGAITKVEKAGAGRAILRWSMPPKVIRAIQKDSARSSRPKTDLK